MRLQDYAPLVFNDFIPSKSGIKKAIKKGLILVNGKVGKTATLISTQDILELTENLSPNYKTYKLALPIIFKDEYLAVINKPAGLIVSGNAFKTLFNALTFNLFPSSLTDKLERPTPVHRLDNQTSGLIIVAKTKSAQIALSEQFILKTIKKKYYTILVGNLSTAKKVVSTIDNKQAETFFKPIKIVKSLKYNYLTLTEAYPLTGRTHQIRIHAAKINHQILGDKLYGNPQLVHKGKGLLLCASALALRHPKTNEKLIFEIDLPHKFKALLDREQNRWNYKQLLK